MSISCDSCTSRILTELVPFSLCKKGMVSAEISAPSCFAVSTPEFLLWPPPCKGGISLLVVTAALWQGRQSAALTQQIFTVWFTEGWRLLQWDLEPGWCFRSVMCVSVSLSRTWQAFWWEADYMLGMYSLDTTLFSLLGLYRSHCSHEFRSYSCT